ncbi:hypothetical protein [Chromobacterium haemolyticum]|uniref:hypothetical protein n=1 Tax=Chromobacterium haemolyticum TaxID=394935 RepID=UPI00244B6B83|nr:hypothetical protein [Chromobacterium haemolyticum]MDH0342011.1 hypothetical protein [Chromobacterium haemolyticum]
MAAFVDSVIENVENLLAWLSSSVKQAGADYCDVESVDDEQTIAFRDGTLATIVRLHGSYRMIGSEEFRDIHDKISKSLKAYLSTGGHALHVFFGGDPDSAARDIQVALQPSMATAKRLGLSLDDLFEEDIRHLSKFCSNEKVFFTLITRPAAITSSEQKRDRKAKEELLTAHPMPKLRDAPNVFAAMTSLRTRHSSFVSAIMGDFRDARLAAEVLEVHDAIYEQRMSVDPDFTDESWRPRVVGDKIPVREARRDPKDMSGAFWPRLDRQIIPRDGIAIDLKTVEVGDRIYAPMYVHLHPADIKPFQQLFTRVVETRMPWRMTFLIESGGLGIMAYKDFISALFGFTNGDNKLVKAAIAEIRNLVKQKNELDVRFRIDFATWAPKNDSKLLATRASRLARAVQGWGGTEVREVSGDPYQGFISSALALSMDSVATPACAILSDAVTMLPIFRPASPWMDGGAVLYRTIDGKIWAYQPNSPVQSSWICVMVAEPRSGKSVNGNQVNLALCLSPGITRLPLIAIIDVGKASSGLISLLQHALPEGQRHLAASIRLRMTPEFAINAFDTQLGCRFPLPHEEAFLVNFISLLVTPIGKSAPSDGMVGLVKMAVQEAYKYYSDKRNAKPYSRNAEGAEAVDRAIEEYGLHIDDQTTWWEIVDQLFEHGATHEAMLAQRYAVPLISDIASISREPQFHDMYGAKSTDDGEPLLMAFVRMLSEASRSYPILVRPTKFDLGDARVVSIDLDEVAKGGSAAADHQAAVCYMLARYVSAKNFYLLEDHIQNFPMQYRKYHEKRINEIRQDKKHIQFDEFHRTKKIQAVREQAIGDMREGGKIGVMVTLISQSVTDYDDAMLEFATCKVVISKQNEVNAEIMRKMFNMSETAEYAVKHLIRPPGPHGSTFVAMFSTKRGDAVHLLNNTIGGIKLWAFSTTSEDTYVRDRLYGRLGPVATRRLLSKLYPGGSIADEVERRKRKMEDSGVIGENADEGVINDLIKDILAEHEAMQQKVAA